MQFILDYVFAIVGACALERAFSGEGSRVERKEVLFHTSFMDIDTSIIQLWFLYENPALIITILSSGDYLIYFTVKPVLFVTLFLLILPLVPHFFRHHWGIHPLLEILPLLPIVKRQRVFLVYNILSIILTLFFLIGHVFHDPLEFALD